MIWDTECSPSQRETISKLGPLRRKARSCIFLRWLESPRGRPAGIHVGEVESVELCPENVAFRAEGGVSLVLLFARACMFHHPGQRELRVFGSLRKASGEVV